MTGTCTLYGYDQFGVYQNEAITFTGASNGGTAVGTKVFAQLSAGTLAFGTAIGSGTARVGVGTIGTTLLFGLPARIGGTTDVKHIAWGSNGNNSTVNGGTI